MNLAVLLFIYTKGVTMDWNHIISIGSLICSVLIVYMTRRRDGKADGKADIDKEVKTAESFKEINVKLDYQTKQIADLGLNYRESTKEMQSMRDDITHLEAKVDKAFSLIDDLKGKE